MPKIYRVMNGLDGRPTVGGGATDLGVRIPADIIVDMAGAVSPRRGRMSVSPTLAALPPHRVPKRLHHLIPRAAGRDLHFVWSMGEGAFVAGEVSAELRLRPDPVNDQHGFVEPVKEMLLADYQTALAATVNEWRIDEAG